MWVNCTLGGIDRFAYPGLRGEVQLLWWKAPPVIVRMRFI